MSFAPSQCSLGGVGRQKESLGLVQAWGQFGDTRASFPQGWMDPAQALHSKCHRCGVTVPQRWENNPQGVGKGCETFWGANRGLLRPRGEDRNKTDSFATLPLSTCSLANMSFPPATYSPGGSSLQKKTHSDTKGYNLDKYTHVTAREAKEN